MAKTGPRTEAGKAVARTNATRHGIMSTAPVVGMEREEEWQAHLQGVEESFRPKGHMEMCLVERIGLMLWRLRRLALYETETAAIRVAESEKDWTLDEEDRRQKAAIPFYGAVFRFAPTKEHWTRKREAELFIPGEKTLERLLRYEAHLQRQLLQSMHELEALQAKRRGDAAPLARMDVTGDGLLGLLARSRQRTGYRDAIVSRP